MKLTEDVIYKYLSDGNWRSLKDMAVTLSAVTAVPPEIAIRAAPSGTPGPDRLVAGYVALLTPVVAALTVLDRLASKSENGHALYAVVNKRRRGNAGTRPLVVATDEQMAHPANTDTGVSLQHIYRLVRDKPGITLDEVVLGVERCWKPLPELIAVRRSMTQKPSTSGRPPVVDPDPSQMSEESIRQLKRVLVIRLAGRGESQSGKLRAVTETRYYFKDGVTDEVES